MTDMILIAEKRNDRCVVRSRLFCVRRMKNGKEVANLV